MKVDVTFAEETLAAKFDNGENFKADFGSTTELGFSKEEVDSLVAAGEANGYTAGEAAGKQAEYDRFWDAYQENGNRAHYENAFAGYGWSDETFAPKYDIVPQGANGANRMFYGSIITDIQKILEDRGLTLDTSKAGLQQTFMNSKTARLGTIDMRRCVYAGHASYTFADSAIETIDKLSVRENVKFSTNIFKNCTNLKNLTVEGVIGQNNFDVQWSVNLSKASIISIIGALSATTSGLAVTLSATAVANAFGSTSADEWTALVATKPNWTISLV